MECSDPLHHPTSQACLSILQGGTQSTELSHRGQCGLCQHSPRPTAASEFSADLMGYTESDIGFRLAARVCFLSKQSGLVTVGHVKDPLLMPW